MSPSREQVVRRMVLDAAAVSLSDAAHEAGVDVVLVKGPSTVRWLYGDEPREYCDVDLLVAPDAVPAIESVLAQAGFEPVFEGFRDSELAEHARVWRDEHGAVIDLHTTFAAIDAAPAAVWEEIHRSSEPMPLANGVVRVPSPAHRALIVALHAAQHGVSHRAAHIDLERAVARVPIGVWQAAAEAAERLGCADIMTIGLQRSPEGTGLARRLGLRSPTGATARLLASPEGKLGRGLARVVTRTGVRRKLAVIGSVLVPSPAWVRSRYPDSSLPVAYLRRYLALPRRLLR